MKNKKATRWACMVFACAFSANIYSNEFVCAEGEKYTSHAAGYITYFCMKDIESNVSVQHGPFVITDENGNTILTGDMLNGEPDGKWTAYYRNGIKRDEGNYSQGKKVGVWIYWNEKGEIDRKEEYLKGKIQVR